MANFLMLLTPKSCSYKHLWLFEKHTSQTALSPVHPDCYCFVQSEFLPSQKEISAYRLLCDCVHLQELGSRAEFIGEQLMSFGPAV